MMQVYQTGLMSMTKACKFLEEEGLLIDNGYKFGTGWLYQGIPAEDLAKIDELLAYGR